MKKTFITIGTVIALALICGVVYFATRTEAPLSGAYAPTGGGTYRLGQSIGASDSTIKISSFKEPVSGIPYTMTYLGSDIEYGTISPQSSISEFISFSGITQNSDGSATLTGVIRGLSRTPGTGGCVASSTLAQSHAGQSILILSNPPCQLAEYAPLRTAATISNIWTFASTTAPQYDANYLAAGNQFVSYNQLAATAIQGGATSTEGVLGLVRLASFTQIGSSTASSTAGQFGLAPLVIPNKYATTTPGTLCGANGWSCLVAGVAGKIKQTWLDLTQSFTFTGPFVVNNASSTISGALNVGSLTVGGAAVSNPKFGGTGADGALSITSGTTTIDLGGAAEVVKNYTSVSITGTGALAFVNAASTGSVVIIKSQGNVTLTSSAIPNIDATSTGAVAAASKTCNANNNGGGGGTGGAQFNFFSSTGGGGGPVSGSTGAAGARTQSPTFNSFTTQTALRYPQLFVGGGGGSGACVDSSSKNIVSGGGSRGGGALIIEVGGALNFTSTNGISVASGPGGNGSNPGSSTNGCGQGGGSGSSGFAVVLYNTATAVTGTINVSSGAGGTGVCAGSPGSSTAGGGGGGNPVSAGNPSGDGSTSAVNGGQGASGFQLMVQNTFF